MRLTDVGWVEVRVLRVINVCLSHLRINENNHVRFAFSLSLLSLFRQRTRLCILLLFDQVMCFSLSLCPQLMAYLLEGRRSTGSRTGSRPSHRHYEKLNNANDIIQFDETDLVTNKDLPPRIN